MKRGSKPTYTQRKIIEDKNLDTYEYLVIKMVGPTGLQLQSKTDESKVVVIYSDRDGIYDKTGKVLLSE